MINIEGDIPLFLNEQKLARLTKRTYAQLMRRVIKEHLTEENINERYPFPQHPKNVQSQLRLGIELLREMEIWQHGGGITKRHVGRAKKIKGGSDIDD